MMEEAMKKEYVIPKVSILVSLIFLAFVFPFICSGGGGGSADDSVPATGVVSVEQYALSAEISSTALLYGAFPGYGLWKHNGSYWSQLTPDTPQSLAAVGLILYGGFGAQGLWKNNGTSWSLLTADNPENMVASETALYGDFGTLGLWKYNGTSWSLLTPDNPQTIAVSGSMLYGGFVALGLWKYDGTSWSWLTSDNPQNIAASGSILYGDFGTLGLWKYNGTSWSWLTNDNPENIAASGSILYGDFGTLGLWKFDGTNWSQLTPNNPENITASGANLYGDFGTLGLWKYDGVNWSLLTPDNPSAIASTASSTTGFTQSDLAGTWDGIEIEVTTAGYYEWVIGNFSIDSAGNVFLNGSFDSWGYVFGSSDLHTRNVIDSSGSIIMYENSLLNTSFHGTMASNKRLVIATTTATGSQLIAFRKQDTSVSYSLSDIAGKSFVYHGLYLKNGGVWEYGYGSVDSNGNLTLSSIVGPSGADVTPPPNFATLAVSTQGFVQGEANFGFWGMLTPDKNTVFGIVDTIAALPGPNPKFIVINFLGASYNQSDFSGVWWYHMLQNAPASWGRGKFTADASGAITYDNSTTYNSFGPVTQPTNDQFLVDATGKITSPTYPTYHGQLSAGKDLYARTRTGGVGYSIVIGVK
jgi:hypothetical protein